MTRDVPEAVSKIVERAYRDGLAYASNVVAETEAERDEAWRTSKVRADLDRLLRRMKAGNP